MGTPVVRVDETYVGERLRESVCGDSEEPV